MLPAVFTNGSIVWSKSEFNPNHLPLPPQISFLVVFSKMLEEKMNCHVCIIGKKLPNVNKQIYVTPQVPLALL